MQQGITDAGSSPGAEFYHPRRARASALPEAERSADVRQWLRLHGELEAALAALPELPASATPQRPLVEPLGGDAALAALLRFIAAGHADSARNPAHPKSTLFRPASQLPPFFHAWRDAGQVGAADGSNAHAIYVFPFFARPASIGERMLE